MIWKKIPVGRKWEWWHFDWFWFVLIVANQRCHFDENKIIFTNDLQTIFNRKCSRMFLTFTAKFIKTTKKQQLSSSLNSTLEIVLINKQWTPLWLTLEVPQLINLTKVISSNYINDNLDPNIKDKSFLKTGCPLRERVLFHFISSIYFGIFETSCMLILILKLSNFRNVLPWEKSLSNFFKQMRGINLGLVIKVSRGNLSRVSGQVRTGVAAPSSYNIRVKIITEKEGKFWRI